jgi:hypothetical protein
LFIKPNLGLAFLAFLMIFSTFSTTGLILSIVLFVIKFRKSIIRNIYTLFLSLISILVLLPIVIGNIIDKVSGDGQASFYWRSFDLLISLQMVAANPIKGIGFGSEVYKNIQEQSQIFLESDILEGRGNTNSIVYIFVVFGIPLALYILKLMYKQSVFIFRNNFLFFIVILTCLSTEPLITSIFFLMILFSNFFSFHYKKI